MSNRNQRKHRSTPNHNQNTNKQEDTVNDTEKKPSIWARMKAAVSNFFSRTGRLIKKVASAIYEFVRPVVEPVARFARKVYDYVQPYLSVIVTALGISLAIAALEASILGGIIVILTVALGVWLYTRGIDELRARGWERTVAVFDFINALFWAATEVVAAAWIVATVVAAPAMLVIHGILGTASYVITRDRVPANDNAADVDGAEDFAASAA